MPAFDTRRARAGLLLAVLVATEACGGDDPVSGASSSGAPEASAPTEDASTDVPTAAAVDGAVDAPIVPPGRKDDGIKNGDESDVDCGGSSTGADRCAVGKQCNLGTDCVEKVCASGVCAAPTGDDKVQNGDETDVDCGGPDASVARCATNATCLALTDCKDQVCLAGKCAAPTGEDDVQNGDESDVDCGGTTTNAKRCVTGAHCNGGSDCADAICTDGLCAAPRGDDDVQNGDESDVDCGGTQAGTRRCRYQDSEKCVTGADCNEKVCGPSGVCAAPSYGDGVQNGNETDVDCGGDGTVAHACGAGRGCSAAPVNVTDDSKNANCLSGACDARGRCADAPSCKPHHGGDTCGRGEILTNETLEAGASHESCCRSIPLNATTRLDKYEITAGRMREFVRRTNSNVASWWAANQATLQNQLPKAGNPPVPVTCASLGNDQWRYAYCQIAQMADYLPSGLWTPSRTFTRCSNGNGTGCGQQTIDMGVYRHLGNTTVFPDRPCANCGQGCWLGTGQYDVGHPTYWGNKDWQDNGGSATRRFSQAELDVKSLNCMTQVMLAAFCAWDGGRLPTVDELGYQAWRTDTSWPWGNSPGVGEVMPGATEVVTFPDRTERLVQMTRNNGTYNANAPLFNVTNWKPVQEIGMPNVRYTWPLIPASSWGQQDMAYLIASPGRMVNDVRRGYVNPETNTEEGWNDLAANLMEATGDYRSNDDGNHGTFPRVAWVGGSFEVHAPSRMGHEANGNVLTKYGKMGGRCARAR